MRSAISNRFAKKKKIIKRSPLIVDPWPVGYNIMQAAGFL